MSNIIQIELSDELLQKIQEIIEGTSISSIEEYILRLIENEFPEEAEYSKEEEELIRERLRRLGYIE